MTEIWALSRDRKHSWHGDWVLVLAPGSSCFIKPGAVWLFPVTIERAGSLQVGTSLLWRGREPWALEGWGGMPGSRQVASTGSGRAYIVLGQSPHMITTHLVPNVFQAFSPINLTHPRSLWVILSPSYRQKNWGPTKFEWLIHETSKCRAETETEVHPATTPVLSL